MPPLEDSLETCAICMLDHNAKLSVVLLPCGHDFHNSCAREWMETRATRDDQSCPLCRTVTKEIVDESGNSDSPGYPFGEIGEPTRSALIYEEQPRMLQQLLRETETRLSRCEELEEDEAKGEEYRQDMQSEKRKMESRREQLHRMLREFAEGEWTQELQAQLEEHEMILMVQERFDAMLREHEERMRRHHELMQRICDQEEQMREMQRRWESFWMEDRQEHEDQGEVGREEREQQPQQF
ncbi:hypothetical protein PMAYCL1PPCAC_08403 [Pristionchus mayeri]|uniref:RING-type domain-containing protein n=1 Tax=Pristionchus mayeri TaxID=1317129 RepID=A0AAN5C5I1_9BILA|nr:hypothetical protein PMAYCL1PPCAC_08403 [Pristionchus mayeri]